MEDMLTTEYDGCGRCLVAVRRLAPYSLLNAVSGSHDISSASVFMTVPCWSADDWRARQARRQWPAYETGSARAQENQG